MGGVSIFLLTINHHILHYTSVYQRWIKGFFLVCDVDILKREVCHDEFVRLAYIEEIRTIHLDITDHDVITFRKGHILTVFWLEELSPRSHHEET